MLRPSLRAAATLSLLFVAGHAYTIDEDCGNDRDLVRTAADHAFALAANAVTELRKTPINPDIDHVVEQLFGYTAAQRPWGPRIEQKLGNLAPISTLDGSVDGATDVRIFCTTKRIEKRKDGRYYNKNTESVYQEDEISNRFAHCLELTPPTAAITFNPEGQASEIQICPWFMTQVRGFKFRDLTELRAGSLTLGALAKISLPVISSMAYTPIDMFQVFDKVILHELTHTTQAGDPKPAEDMQPNPYGWKNCKEWARKFVESKGDFDRPPDFKDPQNNSDSIALLCSAIELIGLGVRVNDDGSLNPPQSRKRDVVMYPVSWVA
ncbi:uncharacterized protein EI97DRAFT_437866 [Westerdykella ornata]|uniref:Lysine-specific metallo-endopeptidase domain-containing protein n=1 Tax=Westerdykella ornata TaxID=318751 RepID=A0A6A6J719_WESOR|nr:uncharacterized protein EI97DRAFT_437866 [Westerdykella ornata]KAF2271436.1 hypothetical protein EI97DRAFT_437866 [Westerdykella ornata]